MVEPGFEPSTQTSDNEPWGLEAVRQRGAFLHRADRNGRLKLLLAVPHPVPRSASPPRRLVKGARVNPEPHERSALPWELALHSGMPSHRNVSKSQFDPVSSARSHSRDSVCSLPVAREAGHHPSFPWVHCPQTKASLPPPTAASKTSSQWDGLTGVASHPSYLFREA